LKAVILAGGFGTRISEETDLKPKPMIDLGGKPILWHILKTYSHHGVNDFVICCGYKSYVIKEYFANYFLHMSDVTIDMKENSMEVHNKRVEPWKITLVDTGEDSMTGGRIKRISEHVLEEEIFFLTYGDGLSDIDITKSLEFHKQHGKLATVTAMYPPGRFGALEIKESKVTNFNEKPKGDGGKVSAGFFILSPKVLSYIEGDQTIWEQEPLNNLSKDGQLMAYEHQGFFQPMDTLRDKQLLQDLWDTGSAPWKVWK
jgi:glucose-1-phosphate cytidylyltransferase